jgi:hypothetical protein
VGGKACRESAREDRQGVSSREIGRVDSINLDGGKVYSLDRERFKALRNIVARVVDTCIDRVGRRLLAEIRTKQGIEWFDVLECGIKPLVVGRRSENHRQLF